MFSSGSLSSRPRLYRLFALQHLQPHPRSLDPFYKCLQVAIAPYHVLCVRYAISKRDHILKVFLKIASGGQQRPENLEECAYYAAF